MVCVHHLRWTSRPSGVIELQDFLGSKIRLLREELEISQKDMAKQLNMSNNTLSQYETSKRTPDFVTLKQIAEYLEVSLDYLAGFIDVPYDPLDSNFQDLLFLYLTQTDNDKRKMVEEMKATYGKSKHR